MHSVYVLLNSIIIGQVLYYYNAHVKLIGLVLDNILILIIQGTSADQDTRFSNKQAKLMKSQKFPPELEHLVCCLLSVSFLIFFFLY